MRLATREHSPSRVTFTPPSLPAILRSVWVQRGISRCLRGNEKVVMVGSAPSPRRKSAIASMKKIEAQQLGLDEQDEGNAGGEDDSAQEAYSSEESAHDTMPPRKKSRPDKKGRGPSGPDIYTLLDAHDEAAVGPCLPPLRQHLLQYHRPLLLHKEAGRKSRDDILKWFDGVSTSRSMPWRKTWIDPSRFTDEGDIREALKRRAYEVWISEIMLQQTRVSTVIGYWTNWIAKWPTIEDLARAEPDEVLSAWRGLGYYSRATRIHAAAKRVVDDEEMQGLLPESADLLQKNVPGVGRYTGGAISSIVFGNAAPMVDGNVLRVLSRQLGIYGDVKGSKRVIDLLWNAADALVKGVAADGGAGKSDRPGRWGQALMELGSTICTPNPVCRSCPVTATCRAFSEGRLLAVEAGLLPDVAGEAPVGDLEDLCCPVCEPFGETEIDVDDDIQQAKERSKKASGKQATLSSFAFTSKATGADNKRAPSREVAGVKNPKVMDLIEAHAKKFPMKVVKKAVRQEETIVCAIRDEANRYLLHKRPAKGLLAGLWELPSSTLPDSNDSVKSTRTKQANSYVASLLGQTEQCQHEGEVGSVPWLFSHLKLTMHVHLFTTTTTTELPATGRWATSDEVEAESMGTGMRKCWTLVKEV